MNNVKSLTNQLGRRGNKITFFLILQSKTEKKNLRFIMASELKKGIALVKKMQDLFSNTVNFA